MRVKPHQKQQYEEQAERILTSVVYAKRLLLYLQPVKEAGSIFSSRFNKNTVELATTL